METQTVIIDSLYVECQLSNLYYECQGYNEKHGNLELIVRMEKLLEDALDQAKRDGSFNPVDVQRIQDVIGVTGELLEQCPTQADVPDFFPADYPYAEHNHPYEIQDFSTRVHEQLNELLRDGTVAQY